jgi:hypothetical protein
VGYVTRQHTIADGTVLPKPEEVARFRYRFSVSTNQTGSLLRPSSTCVNFPTIPVPPVEVVLLQHLKCSSSFISYLPLTLSLHLLDCGSIQASIMRFQSLFFCILLLSFGAFTTGLKGSVGLDSSNFDKILKRFKFALIKFDIQFPYGEKHEAFGRVAENLKNSDDIVVGEVNVQDFGDLENKDLADRFGLQNQEFPVVMLFRQNDLNKPIRFDSTEEFTADRIKQFVK